MTSSRRVEARRGSPTSSRPTSSPIKPPKSTACRRCSQSCCSNAPHRNPPHAFENQRSLAVVRDRGAGPGRVRHLQVRHGHHASQPRPTRGAARRSDERRRGDLEPARPLEDAALGEVRRRHELRSLVLRPASQSDVSVYKNLLFVSGEGQSGRLDCGAEGVHDSVSTARLRGIRIFDITDIANPKYIGNVQTCRGSHTHTVVEDPNDKENVYVYVSGSAGVRSPTELAGCSKLAPDEDPNSALFRIEVIKVPLAHPELARSSGLRPACARPPSWPGARSWHRTKTRTPPCSASK